MIVNGTFYIIIGSRAHDYTDGGYHVDSSGKWIIDKIADVLEIHYLELPKLFDDNVPKDEDEPVVQWMML